MLPRPLIGLLLVCMFSLPALAGPPDFARDVRPILSQHCFKCHGPDENSRQAGLRLDLRPSALQGGDSQVASIVPGSVGESELVARITSSDPDLVMPPPSSKRALTSEQIAILQQWIAGGASYSEHWAFQPIVSPSVPASAPGDANPIDSFVAQAARQAGLALTGPADRATWLRRIYLDLIGVPPTYQEVVDFTSDQRPDAQGRVIDRLLAAPGFGERWARRWLDIARYADTNGYEKDRPRTIWPYRDWVIQAINDDLPQSQFAVQQLAGDILAQQADGSPRSTSQIRAARTDIAARQALQIATGFHRNTMVNEEGGIDPLEYRYYAMVDRVNTTGTAWLGLTLGCVQCHDHKYDPLSQRDYYGLMALLNDVEEPEIEVHDPQVAEAQRLHDQQVLALKQQRLDNFPLPATEPPIAIDRQQYLSQRYQQWVSQTAEGTGQWTIVQPKLVAANMARLVSQPDGSWLAIGDISKRDEYSFQFDALPQGTTALMVEALTDPSMPRQGPGRTHYEGPIGDFFLSEVNLTGDDQAPIKIAQAMVDFAQAGREAEKVLDGDPLTGWSIDGQQGRPHRLVLRLSEPHSAEAAVTLRLLFERYYAAPLGRVRFWATTAQRLDERAAQLPPVAQNQISQRPLGQRAELADEPSALVELFLDQATELASINAEIAKLQAARPKFATTLVMQPRPAGFVRLTHRYHRGEFLSPREVIAPAVPQLLSTITDQPPRDRLELAQWLFAPQHPLTARVLANRYWSALLGRGLVQTEEDFGFQGSFPTNQPLLDWLAEQLIYSQHGETEADRMWSLKRWMRLVLASATYGRSAQITEHAISVDPTNIYLARANRRRLEGEQLRDVVLASAGLLSRPIGGASVYPPQPASITTEGTYGKLAWPESHGGDRYRRGLYTFSKRTAPFAMLATFDAPSGEACLARRESTDTPLQALTVLNDLLIIEAAQELGYRVAGAQPTASARQIVSDLFQTVLLRQPDDEELADLENYFTHQVSQLPHAPDSLKALGSGNKESVKDVQPPDARQAAATLVARILLNTDEFINRN